MVDVIEVLVSDGMVAPGMHDQGRAGYLRQLRPHKLDQVKKLHQAGEGIFMIGRHLLLVLFAADIRAFGFILVAQHFPGQGKQSQPPVFDKNRAGQGYHRIHRVTGRQVQGQGASHRLSADDDGGVMFLHLQVMGFCRFEPPLIGDAFQVLRAGAVTGQQGDPYGIALPRKMEGKVAPFVRRTGEPVQEQDPGFALVDEDRLGAGDQRRLRQRHLRTL